MKQYKYRLKKLHRKHEQHSKWATCNEAAKERIEKQCPNRFEFEAYETGTISPSAIVTDEPKKSKRGRPKKQKDSEE